MTPSLSASRPFEGRTALITGAARGIGLSVALRLLEGGARVLAWDRPQADWSAWADACPDPDARLEGDVGAAADWKAAMDRATRLLGPLDILVNNAGISGPIGPLTDYDDDAFDEVMRVNTRGVYLGMKHAVPLMHGRPGSIVNLSSVSGLGGGRFTIAYTASKHAVIGMTKLAAVELAAHGIRVNAVCPAPTGTEMMFEMERTQSPADPSQVRRAMTRMIPMGRYGRAEEIADAVCFLAGPGASFITGAALPVDGGLKAT